MPARYDITPSAKADIRSIWLYTAETWGEAQADKYIKTLDNKFEEIADGAVFSRAFLEAYPQVRAVRCEHHYVFYLIPEGKRPRIIAILHERMDFVSRLQARLSGR
jgi:toxin ParE1/3/4